jgi:AAA+ ATPase superfamily predicted ATPase
LVEAYAGCSQGDQRGGVRAGANYAVRFSWGGREAEALDLPALFSALGGAARAAGTYFVIIFDEAQEFIRLRGYDLVLLFSHIYDAVSGIELVITGSAIGLVHNFLKLDDPKAPLFGRAVRIIRLDPLASDLAKEFLTKGFEQIGVRVTGEMLDAIVENVDGIIGWLTYCGVQAKFHGRMDDQVLRMTIGRGSALAAEEFSHFLFSRQIARKRYVRIMKHLAERLLRWSAIKRAIESEEGRYMNGKVLTAFLASLTDAGFITKREEEYYVVDPLLRYALREGLIRP